MRKPPNNIQEIIAEVKGFIRVEEPGLRRNKLKCVEGREDQSLRIQTCKPLEKRPNSSTWNNRDGPGFRPRRMKDMTIAKVELERQNIWLEELRNLNLNTPLSTILRKVKSCRVLRAPDRSIRMSPEKRKRNKFYDFHQDHGHTTNECITLKGQIILLIEKN